MADKAVAIPVMHMKSRVQPAVALILRVSNICDSPLASRGINRDDVEGDVTDALFNLARFTRLQGGVC